MNILRILDTNGTNATNFFAIPEVVPVVSRGVFVRFVSDAGETRGKP